jgi:hypothetical protein
MKKLMNILMLSCRKATELIEKKLYFKLTKVESVQLVLHKSMCDACTAYEKQSIVLDKVLKNDINSAQSQQTSTDFKNDLLQKIKGKMQ